MFFKIINTIKFILNSKWIFDQPLKKKIVIYDYLNSYYLSKYLKKNSYVVVGCRREELYFWHFFNGLFTKYFTWNYFDHYLIPLLQKINPNYIITFLDNDPKVYKIKKFLPNTKIIVIQNGMRGYKKDFFSQIQDTKNLKADFVFTFNRHIADIYKKFITCKFYTIGSFKNNFYSIKKNFTKKQLVFISEYKPQGMFNSLLEYNNFYKAEKLLLPILYNFCSENKLKFYICGRSNDHEKELSFYESIFGHDNTKWNFIFKKKSNYIHIDKSEYVVFISSTLGYEAISRGKKVAAITIRSNFTKLINHTFGWPYKFQKNGFFWTNELKSLLIKKKLSNMISSNNQKYSKNLNIVKSKIILHDKNNFIFKKSLKRAGVKFNK